jgi:hypothetical protein
VTARATLTLAPSAAPDVGDARRITLTLRTLRGLERDPTALFFRALAPDGTETTLTYGDDDEVVREGTGVYRVDFAFTASGAWSVRWEATGDVVAAEEVEVLVRGTAFEALPEGP